MKKIINLKVTEAEIQAIKDATDNLSAMTGVGEDDFDRTVEKLVKKLDRMLKRNGLERDYT